MMCFPRAAGEFGLGRTGISGQPGEEDFVLNASLARNFPDNHLSHIKSLVENSTENWKSRPSA
jgi:hypothetical protein